MLLGIGRRAEPALPTLLHMLRYRESSTHRKKGQVTVNLYDWYVGIRGERVERVWPVAARGAVS